jgi:hypothetical protein
MANRYWVGGTGTWSAFNTTNWATSSGGTGGASVPTSTDNAYFDANSNGGAGSFTVTVGVSITVNTLSMTGLAVPFTFSTSSSYPNIIMNGDFIVGASNVTIGGTGTTFSLAGTSSTVSINTNGVNLGRSLRINNASSAATYTIASSLVCTDFSISALSYFGVLNTNNQSITVGTMSFSGASASGTAVNFGSSTITLTGTGLVFYPGPVVLNAGTSTIVLSDTSSTTRIFGTTGYTLYNLVIGGTTGSSITSLSGNMTFNTISSTKTVAHTVQLAGNQTVANWTINGSAGNVVTLNSDVAGTRRTLTKSGGGTILVNYYSIQDSAAAPANTWYADSNSTNVSNNTGWSFGSALNSSISEGLTTKDSETALVTKFGSISESLSSADSSSVVTSFVSAIKEGFTSSDVLLGGNNTFSNITETVVANDSDTVIKVYNSQITEPVSVTDSTACFGFGTIDNTQNTVWVQVDNRQ